MRISDWSSDVCSSDLASGVGWVFEYALVDRHHGHDIDELRALQDFFLKYELQSVPGVAEVASVGGQVRQFQIEADPNSLAAHGFNMGQVAQAVRENNQFGEIGRAHV